MKFLLTRKVLFLFSAAGFLTLTMAFSPKEENPDDKPKNLKVLPKSTSMEEVHTIMRTYSMSLGVRCGFCHASAPVKEGEKPHLDFASDAKEEKTMARGMMKMTAKINKKYLRKIGEGHFEQITCVTCHMGRPKPIISTDSIPAKKW